MEIFRYPHKKNWPELLKRPVQDLKSIQGTVLPILHQVQQNGDAALRQFSLKFDHVAIEDLAVNSTEIKQAQDKLDPELIAAIRVAAQNISKFHRLQFPALRKTETSAGVFCWQKSVAIEKVGLYAPGGTAPLFSSVLMLALPAKLAGCTQIVLCTPPGRDGQIHPAILFAAELAGVNKIFKLGGAQAIAAMAYGTETIPRVYKIFGPGNQYVTAAKQLVAMHQVAIDMPAGPSEVAVIADESANPKFIAADLLSQAEHGIDSQVVLISSDEKLVALVMQELEIQIETLPRKQIAMAALTNSKAFIVGSEQEALELANAYAPEHLILMLKNPALAAEKVINAGSVFLGNYTPEAAGDYASGTNHTLPTNGYARSFSGVSMDSFMKKISFQEITVRGLQNIGPTIEIMARAEKLDAHKNAVSLRLAELKLAGIHK